MTKSKNSKSKKTVPQVAKSNLRPTISSVKITSKSSKSLTRTISASSVSSNCSIKSGVSTDTLSDNSSVERKLNNKDLKKKPQNLPHPILGKSISDPTYNRNDFCLIQFVIDKKFNIVKIGEFSDPKNIKLGGEYSIKYGTQFVKAIVKCIGTRVKCDEKLDLISSYNCDEPRTTKKRKSPTMNEIQEMTRIETEQEEKYNLTTVVKELRDKIKAQDNELSKLKSQIIEKEEKLKIYQNTYDKEQIARNMELSLNFIKLFGTPEDLTTIPFYSSTELNFRQMLSPRFPTITVTREQKLELDSYLDTTTETDCSVFRKTMTVLIPTDEVWAIRDKPIMIKDYSNEIHSAYEFVKRGRENFLLSVALNTCRLMCNEARRRLRGTGIEFQKNDDDEDSDSPIYIMKRERIDGSALKKKRMVITSDDEVTLD